ncbi:2-hydroxychromene-2-carboxylate isomerase [Arhodomonas sp. AD133]|uniref:2-hydroxychromene-2-carboxylate isomerase n=1 Tax=Arhodomonas sp. AD133 TaxID=3415009 RepID=UPI003EB85D9B
MMAQRQQQTTGSRLEFWFDLASNYSYLSAMRIDREAALRGVEVTWKPFLLGPIFRELGWTGPVFVVQEEKGRYVWKDMQRQCRKYGLPWRRPSEFPRDSLLATRVALAGGDSSWVRDFCREIMLLNFGYDREVGSDEAVSGALGRLGLKAGSLIRRAREEDNKQRLRSQTREARARGVFGAPTFFVGEEMFWGNDRLDDALDMAAALGE